MIDISKMTKERLAAMQKLSEAFTAINDIRRTMMDDYLLLGRQIEERKKQIEQLDKQLIARILDSTPPAATTSESDGTFQLSAPYRTYSSVIIADVPAAKTAASGTGDRRGGQFDMVGYANKVLGGSQTFTVGKTKLWPDRIYRTEYGRIETVSYTHLTLPTKRIV